MWGSSALDSTSSNQDGFTVVELLISISVIGILMVSVLVVTLNYYVLITRTNIRVDLTNDSQNLLRSTVEAIRYGAGVRQTNVIADPNGPGGGWNTNNNSFVIIIAVPAVDTNDDYIINPSTGKPYKNELVYYKSGTLLYRRTLKNTSAPNNVAVTTCPPGSATPSCPADTKLLEYLDSMVFTLYDQDDALTTNTDMARSIKIDLAMNRDTFGSPIIIKNSIRVTLRNLF